MQPAVHFIISIGIAFALEIRYRRKYSTILLLGIIGVLPDIDHFLPGYNGAGLFHNLTVVSLIPLSLLLMAILIEGTSNKASSKFQRFFICVAVILFSHLILDLIAGTTISLNLFSESATFRFVSLPILESASAGVIFEMADIAWLILGIIVILGNVSQKRIYAVVEELEEYSELERPAAISERDAIFAIISQPISFQKSTYSKNRSGL